MYMESRDKGEKIKNSNICIDCYCALLCDIPFAIIRRRGTTIDHATRRP